MRLRDDLSLGFKGLQLVVKVFQGLQLVQSSNTHRLGLHCPRYLALTAADHRRGCVDLRVLHDQDTGNQGAQLWALI